MKKYLKYPLALTLSVCMLLACEDVSDNAIPHVAAPALISINSAAAFSADQAVSVDVEFRELRKNGVQIDTLGAAPNIQAVNVQVTDDNGLRTLQEDLSLSDGVASYNGSWESILGTTPEPGASARLEFAGTSTDGIPFRVFHSVYVAAE